MEQTISRAIIETVVRQALREMKDSPERSARNLVDMALSFSTGRFQQVFFSAAQAMLQNQASPYYSLISRVAAQADSRRLFDFGMALGYNSCTLGAARIREIEEAEGYNIPWLVALELDPGRDYGPILSQGQELGIYSWLLYCHGSGRQAIELAEKYRDCAFGLYCTERDTWPSLLEASLPTNIMPILPLEEGSRSLAREAREQGLLYSVLLAYGPEELGEIESGDAFYLAQELGGAFTMLRAKPSCREDQRRRVHDIAIKARAQQLYATLPWEAVYDCGLVDSIISQGLCSAGFDKEGRLHSLYSPLDLGGHSLFDADLSQIFRQAFPKT